MSIDTVNRGDVFTREALTSERLGIRPAMSSSMTTATAIKSENLGAIIFDVCAWFTAHPQPCTLADLATGLGLTFQNCDLGWFFAWAIEGMDGILSVDLTTGMAFPVE